MVQFEAPSSRIPLRQVAKIMLFVLFAQSLPFQAYAQTDSAVSTAIVGFRSGKSGQEEKVRKMLQDELTASGEFNMVEESKVSSRLQDYSFSTVDPKSQASVASAYERYNAGMQYYRKLDLNNALKEFNAAVRGYREGISILRDNHYLLYSHLYLGLILNFLGRTAEGKKFIQEMVILDSERKTRVLPQRDFPPKIVDLHKKVTKEVMAKPMSTLNVDTTPAGAKVMFDGEELGTTPFQIKEIPSGQHFISLDLQGHQFYGAPIQVNPGTQSFTMPLKEKSAFQVYNAEARNDGVRSSLEAVAGALNVDILILGQTSLKNSSTVLVTTQTFDARTSTFSDVIQEEFSIKKPKLKIVPEGLAGTLHSRSASIKKGSTETAVKTSKKEKVNVTEFDVDQPKDNSNIEGTSPFYKKWWFWAGVGVVAVGAGGFFLLSKKSADSTIVTIDNPLQN
jgi:tetratricopeptide (TPR) repeat protein